MFRGPSLRLFSIFGIPIGAHWSLILAVALMGVAHGGMNGALLAVLVFGSVLLHELGHAVVAQRRRIPIAGIDLHFFGGVAKMTAPPRSPNDEIAIAVAGPLMSLALGLGLVGIAKVFGASAPGFVPWLAGVNIMLAVFNMLPALPMDGGRVFRAVMARRHGLVNGTMKAVRVGRYIAVAIAVLAVFTDWWLLLLAALIWQLGSSEQAQVRQHQTLRRMGFRDDEIDPWARYSRAADRKRPLMPDAIVDAHDNSTDGRMGGPGQAFRAQRIVRDPWGRHVVVTETVIR